MRMKTGLSDMAELSLLPENFNSEDGPKVGRISVLLVQECAKTHWSNREVKECEQQKGTVRC